MPRAPVGGPSSAALPPTAASDLNAEERAVLIASTKSPISFLSKLGQTISRKRSPKVRAAGWRARGAGCRPGGRLQ